MITTNKRDRQRRLLIHFLPETILLLSILAYFLLPSVVIGYSPLIKYPTECTVIFTVAFTLVQLGVYCFIWSCCKPAQMDEIQFFTCTKPSPSASTGVMICFACYAIMHIACVLFGAPLFQQMEGTSAWAFLTTTLITVPNLVLLGSRPNSLYQVVVCGKFENTTERYLYFQSVGVLLGSWAAAVVIPLDWDRPWQVWPIPCVVGALLGYMVSILTSCIITAKELKTEKVH
uniref:Phosphatidylinositol-glycan biosynthesis class F protein n=1 Tax=Phallusia mammillata TaxID=59560 RepID=A0A6F9DNU5_9ASCI|nr:phosphatidylinositol-glycan biosynthesis class F protein [Phallusia mammillata]